MPLFFLYNYIGHCCKCILFIYCFFMSFKDTFIVGFITTLVVVIKNTFMLHFYMAFKVIFPFWLVTSLVTVITNTVMLCCYILFNVHLFFLLTTLVTVINKNFVRHSNMAFKIRFPWYYLYILQLQVGQFLQLSILKTF